MPLMSEKEGSKAGSIFLAFLAGVCIGAGLGFLLAPSSGQETREKIKGASHDAKERTLKTADKAKEKVDELVVQGKEKISGAKESVKAAVEAGKEAFHSKKEELTEEAEEVVG